jgi:hypothetical protein
MFTRFLAGCLAASVFFGCAETPVEEAADAAASLALTKNPFSDVEPPRPEEVALRGEVREVLRAGSYTYLSIACEDGDARWVVTMRRGFSAGDRVDVKNMGTRRAFHSKRLGRTFEELVFGVVRPLSTSEKEGT